MTAPSREIPLTKGYVAIVDEADYEWLSQWTWHAVVVTDRLVYARRSKTVQGVRTYTWMHRLIAQTPDGLHTDHIDRDTLNNRRANLRACTRQQNNCNREHIRGAAGYRGVKLCGERWYAKIGAARRAIYLGHHATAEDAARAYDAAAREHHGDYAVLNFPEAA